MKTASVTQFRPTSGRVKETLFNILADKTQGARFLDLFAGIGSIGIEALSRGAESCLFVEENWKIYRKLIENIKLLGFEAKAEAIRADVGSFIGRYKSGRRFDIVFLDPPYESDAGESAMKALGDSSLIKDRLTVILETRSIAEFAEKYGNMRIKREKIIGDTMLLFYEPVRCM